MKPLIERITQGPASTHGEAINVGDYRIAEVLKTPCYRANAEFIAEAFTVAHETQMTPRQMAERIAELEAGVNGLLAETGWHHIGIDALEEAKRLVGAPDNQGFHQDNELCRYVTDTFSVGHPGKDFTVERPPFPPLPRGYDEWAERGSRWQANEGSQTWYTCIGRTEDGRWGKFMQPKLGWPEGMGCTYFEAVRKSEPVLLAGLPPLPPGTRYAGQLKDHEGKVRGLIYNTQDPNGWEGPETWGGMAHHSEEPTADWHLAVPI